MTGLRLRQEPEDERLRAASEPIRKFLADITAEVCLELLRRQAETGVPWRIAGVEEGEKGGLAIHFEPVAEALSPGTLERMRALLAEQDAQDTKEGA